MDCAFCRPCETVKEMWAISNSRRRRVLPTIFYLLPFVLATTPRAAAFDRYVGSSWAHKDGLPSTLIYAITQTTNGYLWLGTSDGLVRFDGINFVHHGFVPPTDPLLGAITALYPAKDGALWIGSGSGFVTRMRGSVLQRYFVGAQVEAIVQSANSRMWVIAQNGLYRFSDSPPGKLAPAERMDVTTLVHALASRKRHGAGLSDPHPSRRRRELCIQKSGFRRPYVVSK